jgi:outer membrane protein OmpA-like peptidoglycan-associated protein
MQRHLLITAAFVGLAAAAACATAPNVNPRIAAAETALARANSDPDVRSLGQASLNDAGEQLVAARQALKRHDDDDFVHAIRMTETHIQVAEAMGDQVKSEHAIEQIADRQSQLQINSRERAVTRAEAGQARAERETTLATAGQARAEVAMRQMREELADYQLQETSLGMSLVLQDLQFASDSSVLREGAKGRLDPLASYLARNESTSIRIAGHTDSIGEDEYNRDLSWRRATAVADYLVTRGVSASHIETVGMGESTPVGSNDTTSGREENRRVEVTILSS